MAASGSAVVKSVLSGDTLILMGRATNGPPPELQLTLSSLMAPKLARSKDTVEEPFAFESREFLRKTCIGKQVTFKVEYKVMAIGRTFGAVMLDGENLCVSVAREGWAKVKPLDPSREGQQSGDYDAMVAAAAGAEAARRGVYGGGTGMRQVVWDADPYALLRSHQGKPVPVVIEHVRDGASFKCYMLEANTYITFNLAGVVCPRVNIRPGSGYGGGHGGGGGGGDGGAENGDAANGDGVGGGGGSGRGPPQYGQPEPFALEAKHFTESRLLNRDVDLMFEGVDKNTLCGTVLHPVGNIAVEVLRQGLGRMSDFTSVHCSRANAAAMRTAETLAKQQRLRVWRTWTPPQIQGDKEFSGVCVEAHSGDQLSVLVEVREGQREERRVMLASVRAPRPAPRTKRGPGGAGAEDEPWAHEARESLRAKVIGKMVHVVVDYDRDIKAGGGGGSGEADSVKRPFATVTYGKGKKNLAEALLSEGVVSLNKHRPDEPKASEFDRLAAAEAEARAARRGLHAGPAAAAAPFRCNDLTGDPRRGHSFLPSLRRSGAMRGIIEHVFNGSRFKVYIAKENLMILFSIAGIRCPQTAGPPPRPGMGGGGGRPAEPLAEEARLFSREHLMQRAVEVEIQDMDKVGMALGSVFVGQGDGRHNYAADLLQAGLARSDERALERMSGDQSLALRTAEQGAKLRRAGIWALEDPAADAAAAAAAAAFVESEPKLVKLSEIVDGSHFFVQPAGEAGGAALREVEESMRQLMTAVGARGAPMEARRGTLCAALFDDGTGPAWYRARVDGVAPGGGGGVRVTYVDHGNTATVPATSLQPLDRGFFRVPEQATECTLALAAVPVLDAEYGRDAAVALSELAWGKELSMRVLGRGERGVASVALHEAGDPDGPTVNEALVREGLARLSKRAELELHGPKAKELAARLKAAQEAAHRAHINIWCHGDVGSDEED